MSFKRRACIFWLGVAALSACSPAQPPSAAAAAASTAQGAAAGQRAANDATALLGLNLGGVDNWNGGYPWYDAVKQATGWLTQCEASEDPQCQGFTAPASAWDTQEQGRLVLDAQGWPTALPSAQDASLKFRRVAFLALPGGERFHPSGAFDLQYQGQGRFRLGLNGREVESQTKPGRRQVEVSGDTDAGLLVMIEHIDGSNPLRAFRLISPGGQCRGDVARWPADQAACADAGGFETFVEASQRQPTAIPWHPAQLADVKGFAAVRFMDWSRINTSTLAEWKDRPKPTDPFWTGPHGVPFEVQFDLSRRTAAAPWISLPTHASDDFARQFARLAKTELAPGQTLYLEYSNEAWNGVFAVHQVLHERGQALWPHAKPEQWVPNAYAKRAVELCRIVKAEFGSEASRVRCVAGAMSAWTGVAEEVLACPLAAAGAGGACGKQFDALAIAPYVGYELTQPPLVDHVLAWAEQGDKGLDRLFEQLLGTQTAGVHPTAPLDAAVNVAQAPTMWQRVKLQAKRAVGLTPAGPPPAAQVGGALYLAEQQIAAHMAVARGHGLPLLAYEGGQHLVAPPGPPNPKLQAFFTAANRDPRMGEVYQRLLTTWAAQGGDLFVLFTHTSPPSSYGQWGLKETQLGREPAGQVKWQAVLDWQRRHTSSAASSPRSH